MNDPVNHPKHYNSHESGVEAIEICERMSFCVGNAVKYVFRAGEKGDRLEDLKKARWYLQRDIEQRTNDTRAFISATRATEEALKKIWATPTPTLLGMFLWALARGNIQLALDLVNEEIQRAE